LLSDYGRAWVTHNDGLLAGTLSARLIKTQTRSLDNAQELTFSTFRVHASTQFSGNLAYARIRALYPRLDVRTYHVIQDTAISTESKPYSEDGAFTFAREAPVSGKYGGWRLISTTDLEVLAFFSPHN